MHYSKELKISEYNSAQNEINKSCRGIPSDVPGALKRLDAVEMIIR